MVDVFTEIIINKPIQLVADYAANPDNAPVWYENIKSAEWRTPKPLSVGSKIAFIAHFLGKKLAYTYEIVVFDPGAKLIMRTAEGPFPMETTYTWMAVDDLHTKMTLRNAGQLAGFSRFLAPIMTFMIRRANTKDLKAIKKILEAT